MQGVWFRRNFIQQYSVSIRAEELVIPIFKTGRKIPKIMGGNCLLCICFYPDQDLPQLLDHTSCALSLHMSLAFPCIRCCRRRADSSSDEAVLVLVWGACRLYRQHCFLHSFQNSLNRCPLPRLLRVDRSTMIRLHLGAISGASLTTHNPSSLTASIVNC